MMASRDARHGDAAARSGASAPPDQLVAARQSHRSLERFPGPVPANIDEAYGIQDTVLARDPAAVAGWKLGAVPAGFRSQFGERFTGPVMDGTIRAAPLDGRAPLRWTPGWFQAVEAEFVFRLSRDLPPRENAYQPAEIIDAVGAVHAGVELLASPVAGILDLGPGAVISDYGVNAGLVIGPEVADWTTRPADSLSVSTTVGRHPPATGSAAAIAGGLTGALVFLVNELNRRGRSARRGDWICTGATTGLHPIDGPCEIVVDFAGLGTVTLEAREGRP